MPLSGPVTFVFRDRDPHLGFVPGPLHLDSANDTIWVAAGGRGESAVMRCHDGEWTVCADIAANGLRSVLALGADVAVVSGENGMLARTVNGGRTFKRIPTGTHACLFALSRDRAGNVWVGGDEGLLLVSSDEGRSFSPVPAPEGRIFRVLPHGASGGWLVSEHAIATIDDRRAFVVAFEDRRAVFNDIAAREDGVLLVVADGGKAWRSTDSSTFDEIEVGTDADLGRVCVSDGRFVVLGGDGRIRTSEDGITWSGVLDVDPTLRLCSMIRWKDGWLIGAWNEVGPPFRFVGALAFVGPEECAPKVIAPRSGIARPPDKPRTVTLDTTRTRKRLGAADYALIDPVEADRRFAIAENMDVPYDALTAEHEIRLYEGDVVVDAFEAPSDGDEGAHNVIVDGNLIVAGTLDWADFAGGSFLHVTGAISVQSAHFRGCSTVQATLLEAEHAVVCQEGDDGGYLDVGTLRAQLVIQTSYFNVTADRIDGFVMGDSSRVKPRVDLPSDEAVKVLRLSFIDPECGEPDVRKLIDAMSSGEDVFRDDLGPARRRRSPAKPPRRN